MTCIGAQCPKCKRYLGDLQCEAYPKKIPSALVRGDVSHRQPHKGDGGLRYKPKEGFE